MVLLALQHQLLHVPLLLPQDLDGLLVAATLLIQTAFQLVHLWECYLRVTWGRVCVTCVNLMKGCYLSYLKEGVEGSVTCVLRGEGYVSSVLPYEGVLSLT